MLVGAVVLSVAYGGLGPGIVTLALAWAGALWLLEPPGVRARIEDGSEWVRWGVALAIAAFLLAFMLLLRRERERATTAVEAAEDAIRDTSALQDLAAACSASLTRAEVARALVERLPGLLGARAGAMAMIDGPDLVVVDPESAPCRRIVLGSHPVDGAGTDRPCGRQRRPDRRARPHEPRAVVSGRHRVHAVRPGRRRSPAAHRRRWSARSAVSTTTRQG